MVLRSRPMTCRASSRASTHRRSSSTTRRPPLMIDHAHVEAYLTGMAERYRARGAFSTAATVRGVEQLAPALWLVDVRWDSFDETGEPTSVSVETYRYLVRAVQPDEPLIVAAVVTG